MQSATITPITTPTTSQPSGHVGPIHEDRRPRRPRWGALYAILLAGVALCIGGSLAVSTVGSPAVLQYGVALLIVGLLGAWIRNSRAALSTGARETQSGSEQPFSIIHVAFSPETTVSGPRVLAEPTDPAPWAAAIRPAPSASQR